MDVRKFVLKETLIIALGELIGVAAMIGIFALLGCFDMTVLLGGVVGGVLAIVNFFAMAIGANIAADKAKAQNVKGGQATVRISYLIRMVLLFLILFAFVKSGLCNAIATVVPLIFVRFTMTVAEFFKRKPGEEKA